MGNKINVSELLKDCPKGMELDCTINDDVKFIKICSSSKYPIILRTKNGYEITLTKYGQVHNMDDSKCVIFPKGKTTWEGFHRPFQDGDIVAYDGADGETQLCICKDQSEINHCCLCYLRLDCDGELDLDKGWYYITRFATEEEKAKLFKAIKHKGYRWNSVLKTLEKLPKFKVGNRVRNKNYKDYIYDILQITDKGYKAKEINADSPIMILFGSQEANYELVPNKFDITTLVPFESKVLVRNDESQRWVPAFWGYKVVDGFITTFGWCKYCIPYKGNENLFKTNNDCDDFYKTWEK